MSRAVEVVTVGTELLLGETIDTNSAVIGQLLATRGIRVARRATVSDDLLQIKVALGEALDRTGRVLVTGGLGPTRDDLTRDAVAELMQAPLEFNHVIWDELVARWQQIGRPISESNRSQAMVPQGAEFIPNRWGSAPGIWWDTPRGLIILLPGVPLELEGLLAEQVLPRLELLLGVATIESRLLRTGGIPESRLGETLGPLEASLKPVTLAYLPDQAGIDLRLTAWELPAGAAREALDRAEWIVQQAVGRWIYTVGQTDLAAVLLDELRRQGLTLATAESCTGGLVGGRLTAIAGSSDVFQGGVVCYSNKAKTALLGVPEEMLAEHGAVSEPVARAMAIGAVRHLNAEAAIAVTGVAGPGGGSPDKPVGTVWFGWAVNDRVQSVRSGFAGDRHQIRTRATQAAMLGLLEMLRATPVS